MSRYDYNRSTRPPGKRGGAKPGNKNRETHGEQAEKVDRDLLPEIAAELAGILEPDGKKLIVATNLARRAVNRRHLKADVAGDLDVSFKLDDADRADVTTLVKVEESERVITGPQAVSITLPVTLTAGSPCILVRAAGDRSARLMPADRAPGGVPLLEMPNGSWVPAREVVDDPDLGGEWHPVQPMLTATADDDGDYTPGVE